jgi:hypothetical protein
MALRSNHGVRGTVLQFAKVPIEAFRRSVRLRTCQAFSDLTSHVDVL